MARPRNPLSKRNRNATFTQDEVKRAVALAASKRARVVRDRSEFDVGQLASLVRSPMVPAAAHSWSIEQIVAARDAQMSGRFRMPARLAESMGTDDAIFTARGVRLAPVQSLGVSLTAGKGPKGARVADEAEALFGLNGAAVSSETVTTLRTHLADHGVAFGAITWRPRADGSRWDPQLVAWPIEFVWWDTARGQYVTQVRRYDSEPDPSSPLWTPQPVGVGSPIEPIVHGDGRWVVFAKSELLPHRLDAALLPAAMVWARHAFAMRDWAKGSASHGNPKVIGELPENTALSDAEGGLTAEASSFLTMLQAVASQDSPIGIKPANSKIDYMVNSSGAWEVWVKLAETAERAAARIFLGTDGVLGAQGGAPGVDISALFGVATSKIQSDLACIERGIQSGLISPWCAVNWGDDKSAPLRSYVFPDPDEAATLANFAQRNAAFNADIKGYRENGFALDQAFIDTIAEKHNVPSPRLPGLSEGLASPDPMPSP